MTEQNPAIFLQSGSHPAEDVRRMFHALAGGSPNNANGIFESGDLAVAEKGTPNMSVDIAEGAAWIAGSEATYQGSYFIENRASLNIAVAAADATNPRKDLVVAKVEDSAYSGATNAWSLSVVTGTPAASPSEPAVPANSIVLAMIDVAALSTTVLNAVISDRRIITQEGQAPRGTVTTTSVARPASPQTGDVIYETDTTMLRVWNGSSWDLISNGSTWQTWTPVITQSVTITHTVTRAKYFVNGSMITAQGSLNLTSAGTAGNNIQIGGLPFSAAAASAIQGSFRYFDAGNTNFVGTILGNTIFSAIMYYDGDGNALGVSSHTVANADTLAFQITYEVG
jgi:hypothetical protein